MAKGSLAGRQIELPHAAEPVIVNSRHSGPVGHEPVPPDAQGLGVMQAQDLDIGHDEPAFLDRRENLGHGGNVAAGKDVFLDPGGGGPRRTA